MNYQFHNLLVMHCPTGEAFTHTNYCESPERALELARLTFSAAIWHVSIPSVSSEAAKMDMVGRVTPCAPPSTNQLSLL